jgi:tetratricopeptide (TPR) repeat protein
MPSVRPTIALALAAFALGVALILTSLGCSSEQDRRVDELLEYAPLLPRDVAYQLVVSDDSTLAHYIESVGDRVVSESFAYLTTCISCDSLESYVSSTSVIFPASNKLARLIAIVYRNGDDPAFIEIQHLPPEEGFEACKLIEERSSTFADTSLSIDEKIERTKAIAGEFQELGLPGEVALSLALVGEIYGRSGQLADCLRYSTLALEGAMTAGLRSMTCQLMGLVGSCYEMMGDDDSVHVYWSRALELSRRKNLSFQEARIITFYAQYYARAGRLAYAHDLYDLAIDVAREKKVGRSGLRFFTSAMQFHADLGAWEIVGRNLPRAKSALNHPGVISPGVYVNELSIIEARYVMAKGDVDSASELFETQKDHLANHQFADLYPRLLHFWAAGLIENGRFDQAIPVISEGLHHSQELNNPILSARFLVLRAEALLNLGDVDAAEAALERIDGLDAFDNQHLRYEMIVREILRAQIDLARGNRDDALVDLESAVDRLESSLRELDASVHGYLWLGRCDELRQLLHQVAEDDPAIGYGIEFYWRDIGSALGVPAAGKDVDRRPLLIRMEEYAREASAAVAAHGAVHCVYLIRDDDVWRWTASGGEVRRDVLSVSPGNLSAVVKRSWGEMSADPGSRDAAVSPALQTDLRNLAAALLPPEILRVPHPEAPPIVFVTAHGYLDQLPFEALDIGTDDEYVPLVSLYDVAYLRHARESVNRPASSQGLIVANNSGGEPGRNICEMELSEVDAEGRSVLDWHPSSEFLTGRDASKSNVLAGWQDASFLYFATHVLQDPDASYLSLLPLAEPEGPGPPLSSGIDMEDILSADLSNCGTVVLPSCQSGKGFVGTRNSSPGLGTAFLDSGAGTVVQTFWNVRDEDARQFMTLLGRDLAASPAELIRALSDARREYMRCDNCVRHPFSWAPYSIQLGEL